MSKSASDFGAIMNIVVVVFFAHPDDETMLCGGTLALLSSLGVQIHYLCATRGEGGEVGEPPLCTREELGRVRSAELACAVEQLGGNNLTFLGYTDPEPDADGVLRAYAENVDEVVNKLCAHLHRTKAQALLTHGTNGEYGHPAHVLCHQAAVGAIRQLGSKAPLLYTFQAAFEEHPRPRLCNQDDPADLILDLPPEIVQRKTAAALCHRTQHALFVRNRSREVGRQLTVPEVIVTTESIHRVHPPAHPPQDELASLLLKSGCARRA